MEDLRSLESKSEILRECIESSDRDIEQLRKNLMRIEGFSYGQDDLSEKLKRHVELQKTEIEGLVAEGKVNVAAANFVVKILEGVLLIAQKTAADADRLLHIRKGEIVGVEGRRGVLETRLREVSGLIEGARSAVEIPGCPDATTTPETPAHVETPEPVTVTEVEEAVAQEVPLENPPEIVKSKSPRIRPDRNPATRTGRAALDIAERKSRARERVNNK